MGKARAVVHRRFPIYEATIRTTGACDAKIFDPPRRRGFHRALKPVIDGELAPNDVGGCDVRFRVRYPRLWWVFDIAIFLLAGWYIATKATPRDLAVLVPAMIFLIAVTFFGLPLKGAAFARRVQKSARS